MTLIFMKIPTLAPRLIMDIKYPCQGLSSIATSLLSQCNQFAKWPLRIQFIANHISLKDTRCMYGFQLLHYLCVWFINDNHCNMPPSDVFVQCMPLFCPLWHCMDTVVCCLWHCIDQIMHMVGTQTKNKEHFQHVYLSLLMKWDY
jgi:hypothetical protein